jgi:hypothetical protein
MNPHDGVEAVLPRLLEESDLVKFARAETRLNEAKLGGTDLRAIVDHVEARLNPASQVAKRLGTAKSRAA